MMIEGSGEDVEDIFTRVPVLELLRGPKGEDFTNTYIYMYIPHHLLVDYKMGFP